MTITYPVKHGIYVNMTNRCPCACTFCLRQNGPGVYGSDPLWLEREPTVQEVCDSLDAWDLEQYEEVVFCGYGEPTERLDDLLKVAAHLKEGHPHQHQRTCRSDLAQAHRPNAERPDRLRVCQPERHGCGGISEADPQQIRHRLL